MSDSTTNTAPKNPLLSNKIYDQLKWLAQYGFPALGAFYYALAAIWGFPYAEQVIGTITATDLLLGVILGISTKSYVASGSGYDGSFVVDPAGSASLVFTTPISSLQKQNTVTLKVTPP